MTRRRALIWVFVLTICTAGFSNAAELTPQALEVWNRYIRTVDSGMQARLDKGHAFLWADEAPERGERLRQGDILASPVEGHGWEAVPGGLIHHWIGAVFIPNAGIEDVLAVVHDYGEYKQIYKPTVVQSRVLNYSETQQNFSMLWLRKVLFVTAAISTDYQSRDFHLDGKKCYNVTASTRVQEVQKYGRSDQHLLPPDEGDGFIWRIYGIARYAERDGGVYVELEALALTRDIPASLRWMVAPVVTRLSRSSIVTTLQQTRAAVQSGRIPLHQTADSRSGSPKAMRSVFTAKPSMSQSWLPSSK